MSSPRVSKCFLSCRFPVVPVEEEPDLVKKISTEVGTAQKGFGLGDPAFAGKLDALIGELLSISERETALMRRLLDFALGKMPHWKTE